MKIARRNILVLLLVGCVAAWGLLLALERHYGEEENYTQIEAGLYMGGSVAEPPPHTEAVLNLCEMKDSYECVVHVWDPIRDSAPAPKIEWLKEKVAFVEAQQNAGRTTFVHCFQGASRSGLVVTAYLMRKHHWTRDKAMAFIRTKRPQLRPNPAFMELLREWEASISDASKKR